MFSRGGMTRNTTLSPPQPRETTDRLSECTRLVSACASRDRHRADLRWRLKLANLNQPSISGLSDNDYPSLAGLQVPELVSLGTRPIPQELVDQYDHIQSHCAMGLFPEICRAWLTIDSDLYMWNYEDNTDLAFFDGLRYTIMKLHLARPRPGVFPLTTKYVLVIATTADIVLMAVGFEQGGMEAARGGRQGELSLVPEPLLKIPLDGAVVSDIASSLNGRVFFSAHDGCLYELEYHGKSWFRQQCKKINHSKGIMSYLVPAFVSFTFGKDEPLEQIAIDETRHILFTRSRNGSIQVYDLGVDGLQTSKVTSISGDRIEHDASAVCTTVDRSHFRNVIHIAAIPATDSHDLNLIATTEFGVRLYYTCYYPPPSAYYNGGVASQLNEDRSFQDASYSPVQYTTQSGDTLPRSQESSRPLTLRLLHVRLPPGFCMSTTVGRPTRTHLAFYSSHLSALITYVDEDSNGLWTLGDGNFPFVRDLAETLTQMPIRGQTWAIARALNEFDIERYENMQMRETRAQGDLQMVPGQRPPLVVYQHLQSAQRLIGVHVFEQRRPVDVLRELLARGGCDAATTSAFFQLHGCEQACAMALLLLCSSRNANTIVQVHQYHLGNLHIFQDAAIRALFVYGGDATVVYGTPNNAILEAAGGGFARTPIAGGGADWSPRNSSLAEWTQQMRTPLQSSTPQPSSPTSASYDSPLPYSQSPMRRQFGTPLQASVNREQFRGGEESEFLGSPAVQVKFSERHDAIYLCFSRIVGVLWQSPLCIQRGDQLDSAFRSEELGWLVSQLCAFRDALDKHGLIPRATASPAIAAVANVPTGGGSGARVDASAATRAQINKKNMVEAAMRERHSLTQLWDVIVVSCEVMGLWRVLVDHQFPVLVAQLPIAIRNVLQQANLASLVIDGHSLCSDLITCLIRQYIADSATTTALSERLRVVCPGLYTCDDAMVARATEVLQEARGMNNGEEKTRRLHDAVSMLVKVVSRVHLPTVCLMLQEAGCYEGVVELGICAAESCDPRQLALIAYRNRVDANAITADGDDAEAARAINARNQCYACITESLDHLSLTPSSTIDTELSISQRISEHAMTTHRDAILRAVFASNDELAHVAIFKWLLERNQADVILKSGSPYVHRFLRHAISQGGGQRYLDLLWRHYEKSGEFMQAACLLQELAERPSGNIDLKQRVSYLAQAIMCTQSASNVTSAKCSEFMQEIRDKIDVARIQLALRDALQAQAPIAGGYRGAGGARGATDLRQALDELNKQLYNATTLFQDYAVRFDLPEMKLAIVRCAGHSDATVIEQLWKEIIEKELTASNEAGESSESRMKRLTTRLTAIAKQYANTPVYLPLEVICRELHNAGCHGGFPPTWMVQTMNALKIPPQILVTMLNKQYRSRDPVWKGDRRAQEQLVRTALCVANDFADRASEYPTLQRRAVKTELLDMFAAFAIDLQSAAPAGERARLYEQTRLAQSRVERLE